MSACVDLAEIVTATEGTTVSKQSIVYALLRCAAYMTNQKGGQTFKFGDLDGDPVASKARRFGAIPSSPSHASSFGQ